jgi:hypothetical protein
MNLQDFIDLRSHCPMCGTSLITKFISDRKQKNRTIEDKYAAILVMRGMRSCEPDYEVGYHFGLRDNSVSIEFYNEWDMSASASMYMVKIFKDFHKNLANTKFKFLRTCGFCFKYEMMSKPINIDLKAATYSSIDLSTESFVFVMPGDEDKKYVRLDNHLEWGTSDMWWWRDKSDYRLDWSLKNNCSHRFDLPFIPFVSKDETGRRLSNLITFS